MHGLPLGRLCASCVTRDRFRPHQEEPPQLGLAVGEYRRQLGYADKLEGWFACSTHGLWLQNIFTFK